MQKPIISTRDTDITYNLGKSNEFKALKSVDVDIYPREYIILFGPSGCGKSTLLYSIFGVLAPSRGKVIVKGDSIYDYTPDQMVEYQRKTMGIMYQQFNLIPSITVLDNVGLPLIFAEMSPSRREERARELLKRFGIDHVRHKRPSLLSGGQQQRVSVARSLVNDPEILIADEPVGNLDSISAEQVMDTLEQINEQDKKTVLLVTHDAKYLPYAHRVFYMKDGFLERIVVNPEKKQVKRIDPGETIVTEIEQLARIYPYSTPEELQVKSIVNYLTQEFGFDEILRLEKFARGVIEGKMSKEFFEEMLVKDLRNGGAGLTSEKAHIMAEKITSILRESRDIMRYRRVKDKNDKVYVEHEEFLDRVQTYILEEMNILATPIQLDHLHESLLNRFAGYIRKETFEDQLILPIEKGGCGFKKITAHAMTRYLEKLLAQGVDH